MNDMFRRTGIAVFCVLLTALAFSSPVEQPLKQEEAMPVWLDLTAGRARALEQDRPLLIHFTADWCHWCKVMQRDTYTHSEVHALMSLSFVTVMIDADRQPRLRAEFGVQGLPTVWFLTSDGEPITYLPGYVDGLTFLQVLKWIDSGAYRDLSFKDFQAGGS